MHVFFKDIWILLNIINGPKVQLSTIVSAMIKLVAHIIHISKC